MMTCADQLLTTVCGMAQSAHLSGTLTRKERNSMGSQSLNITALLSYSTKMNIELLWSSAGLDDAEATNVNLLRRFAIERCCKHEAPNGAS